MASQLTNNAEAGVSLAPIHHQWFITNTLRGFLVGQSANPKSEEYEILNVLERWLITMANQANDDSWRAQNPERVVPWAKIYHILNVNDPHVIKFSQELRDKMTFAPGQSSDTIISQLIPYINSQLVSVNLSEYASSIMSLDGVNTITYGIDQITVYQPITKRVQDMINMSDISLVMADSLYYQTILSRGNQWGLPQVHYDYLYNNQDVRNEAFASPFNSRLFGKPDSGFFSLFPQLESVWGSLGNFFNADLSRYVGNFVLNPPFIESIMEQAVSKVITHLDNAPDDDTTVFFIVIPAWKARGNKPATPAYTLLNNSQYNRASLELLKGTYNYEDVDGSTIPASFNSVYFALSKVNSDSNILLNALKMGTVESIPVSRSSSLSGSSTVSGVPSVSTVSGVPSVSTVSGVPRVSTVSGVPRVSTVSGTPGYKDGKVNNGIESPTWFDELIVYLRGLLERATSDPAVIERLLSEPTHKVWRKAFTHESWNRNKINNYQTLETMGDKVIDTTFMDYTLSRFPEIKESELTELRNEFVSKDSLAPASVKMGLPRYVLTKYPVSTDTEEDLFESFFGALFTSGDIVYGRGTGYSLCKVMTSFIYDEWGISPEIAQKSSTNRVKETFEKLAWSFDLNELEEFRGSASSGWTMYLKWPDLAFVAFEQRGTPLQIEYFARGQGKTRGGARQEAYDSGIKALNAMGLTVDVADRSKLQEKLVGPLRELIRKVNADDIKGVFNEITFTSGFFGDNESAVQLIGLYNTEESETVYEDVLVTVIGPAGSNIVDLQRAALTQFINYGKTEAPIML